MMRKEAGILLSSLVGMVKIYQSDNSSIVSLGLYCTNGGLALRLYCSKILGALILILFSRFSTPPRFRERVEGF